MARSAAQRRRYCGEVVAMLCSVTSLALLLLMSSTLVSPAETKEKTPVLVELFTSEGCSSCPPADALLKELQTAQPVPGARIVALGLHVDYWNYIGWTDRFSSPRFTARQENYSRRFTQGPYTPQVVVDGATEFVGSDRRAALRTIAAAARKPKPFRVELMRRDNKLHVLVEGARLEPSDIVFAVIENNVETKVLRGENQGRVLRHTAVARNLDVIGSLTQEKWEGEVPLPIPGNGKNLEAMVFVQSHRTGQVLGVDSISLQGQ